MVEVLAEEIHNMWCKWTKKLMKEEKLSAKRLARWKKECHIPYDKLSEPMKDLDRKIAKRILRVIREARKFV
jgi:hypothetical protein